MAKIKCSECNTINKVSNKVDSFYCNKCGKKINMPKKEKKSSNKLVILLIVIIVILLIVIIFLLFGKNIKSVGVEETTTTTAVKEVTAIIIDQKDSYDKGEQIELNAKIYPEDAADKTITWKLHQDSDYKIIEGNTISFSEGGTYEICAFANNDVKSCKEYAVIKECLSRYTFNFENARGGRISVGKAGDICAGTYRVTASTLNDTSCPMVTFNNGSGYMYQMHDSMMICYGSPENGQKHAIYENTYIEAEEGYTKLVFQKVQ